MSYANQLLEHKFQSTNTTFDASIGTDLAWFLPGYQPALIRAAFFIVGTTMTASGQLNFTSQATAFSNVGITAGDVAILKMGVTVAGKVIYKDGLTPVKVSPGGAVVMNIKVAETTGAGVGGLSYEQSWETPANNTSMVVTA